MFSLYIVWVTVCVGCFAVIASPASVCGADGPQSAVNVLMIAIDDQNDWIGCLNGHPQARTPHIDCLAQAGTVFLNAHCQAPLCNPSRVSLLTGLRPSSTGVYGLSPALREVDNLRPSLTLPQSFHQAGYETLMAGKIYHGAYGRRQEDGEFDVVGPAAEIGASPVSSLVETPSGHPLVDWGTFPHRDEDKGDWKLASWTIDQLKQPHDGPFFLSVGFFLPHVPCYVSQEWYDLFPVASLQLPVVPDRDRDDVPRFSWYLHWRLPEPRLKFLRQAGQWENLARSYLASTAFVDAQVGRILDSLAASPYADNTVVVLWSDHGWHLGEKGITGKNSLWERATRVPLIFAGPGIAANARCREPVELLDIFPTLCDVCRLSPPSELEGHSLLAQLKDADAPREWPAITTHNHDNHSVRSREWRYIRYADGSEELYHTVQDPGEWVNLAASPDHRSVIADHVKWLPSVSRKPVPGSRDRILLYDSRTGIANWEGEDIPANALIPEVEE